MRLQRIFAATATLAALTTLATACEDPAKAAKPAASPSATAAASAAASPAATATAAATAAAPATLAEAQAYVRKYTPCENLITDPKDSRVNLTGYTPVGITERGVCLDDKAQGEIVISMVSDAKAHQQAEKDHVTTRLDEGYWDAGLYEPVFYGKGFTVSPRKTEAALALAKSDLRVLVCNPDFTVPEGYKKEKALVDGCVLTDFVNSRDGKGSPVKGPALASAGSIEELRKLVSPKAVDCTEMVVTDEHVQSIDYLPVVGRDGISAWGVKQRAVCGKLGGATRAHNLNWLDLVSDMKTLQTRSKASQLAEVGQRRNLTQSKLLVGTNVAVESNNPAVRQGLYKLGFLRLECEPAFSAPAKSQIRKAQVDGCVLTDFELPGV
ncbi:hypothetical protein [Streptomyces lavendulae]|uniref:hypothetical protein n=1 Tax=Streptomyces lavendulae TaxID=1914 RepID=UPI0024A36F9A|nr:hypothetical protein [Streptomyces lavendulae]GLX17926.1 hypothetical protein Slala01_15700 [Streptomyces lavendulae subsp. lavendulae]GLX26270.1 hypothetical protein Slala02_20900 [Streptomyces lavendulae subsp. lavendulae]